MPAAGLLAGAAAVALLLPAPWMARQVSRADLLLARTLLGPSRGEELALRVESLARSRADAVAAADAEPQYVEEAYATDLLSEATTSVGYLLKDRVAHVRDFLDAVRRIAADGTALDPEVVAQLLVRRRDDPISRLTPRELQVLKLMAEGSSNSGIVATLKVSPSAVEKYVTSIFAKLDLPATGTEHRRVLAVLKYLGT
jgi:DNA-binding NarL/FixJ family response regulator